MDDLSKSVVQIDRCTCSRSICLRARFHSRSFPLDVFSWRRIAFDRQERFLPTYKWSRHDSGKSQRQIMGPQFRVTGPKLKLTKVTVALLRSRMRLSWKTAPVYSIPFIRSVALSCSINRVTLAHRTFQSLDTLDCRAAVSRKDCLFDESPRRRRNTEHPHGTVVAAPMRQSQLHHNKMLACKVTVRIVQT